MGFGGRAHAVVGDVDGVLRQWDLRTCMQHGPALTGHTGAIERCRDRAVRRRMAGRGHRRRGRHGAAVGSHHRGADRPRMAVSEPVTAVAVATGGVVVGFGFEVAVLDTPVFRRPAASS